MELSPQAPPHWMKPCQVVAKKFEEVFIGKHALIYHYSKQERPCAAKIGLQLASVSLALPAAGSPDRVFEE